MFQLSWWSIAGVLTAYLAIYYAISIFLKIIVYLYIRFTHPNTHTPSRSQSQPQQAEPQPQPQPSQPQFQPAQQQQAQAGQSSQREPKNKKKKKHRQKQKSKPASRTGPSQLSSDQQLHHQKLHHLDELQQLHQAQSRKDSILEELLSEQDMEQIMSRYHRAEQLQRISSCLRELIKEEQETAERNLRNKLLSKQKRTKSKPD